MWERAAPEAVASLDPGLRAYFTGTAEEVVGKGRGVFRCVGTPRRWLWPMLWLLGKEGIVFPVWQQDVAFEVVNRPSVDSHGRAAIFATRNFKFANDARQMVDVITAEQDDLLCDYLGKHGWLAASLRVEAVHGAMQLSSERIRIRVPGGWLPVPKAIAPWVQITERFEPTTGKQHVRMQLSQPQLGLLYEYDGEFSYWRESA